MCSVEAMDLVYGTPPSFRAGQWCKRHEIDMRGISMEDLPLCRRNGEWRAEIEAKLWLGAGLSASKFTPTQQTHE